MLCVSWAFGQFLDSGCCEVWLYPSEEQEAMYKKASDAVHRRAAGRIAVPCVFVQPDLFDFRHGNLTIVPIRINRPFDASGC